jgi:phosphate binding protein
MKRTLAVALCLLASIASADDLIRIKGSDTIGGEAMPQIADAYRKQRGSANIEIGALGSGTAFVGLFDGSADLGEASRPITEKEQATAKQLGLKLHEVVIGYDGVAVVVNPENPVKELSIAQVSALFSGKERSWKAFGGTDEGVRLIGRPTYSGTHAFFKEKALRRGDAKGPEEFASGIEVIEENGAILDAVAKDPRAVAYVGLGWLRPSVKAVPISANGAAVPAALETVRTGKYPLYRPLLMYVPSTAKPETVAFVRFVLSKEGGAIMAKNGFVPPDSVPAEFTDAAASASAPAAKKRETIRILFASGSAAPRAQSEKELARIAQRLEGGGWSALIVGHADSTGPAAVNQKVALARAHAVANRLLARGVKAQLLAVDAQSNDAPAATNGTAEGRAQNRRVDVELVEK